MTDINFITNNVKYNLNDFDITDDDGRDMTGTASYNGQEYKVNCSYNDDRPIALQIAEQIKEELDGKADIQPDEHDDI